ncbi:MAG TPA: undecaprenyl-diphosphate phosphatase [Roseimicrobium sp.]|nr:undecaprenyl-diphosphate phosphatase [Roseimicrobium sp.]
MPDWLVVVLLGIVEGITEFIPVSSTGHLLIAEHWLPRQSDLFNVVIQSGAVLAVIPLFWTRIRSLTLGFQEHENRDFLMKVILAFGLTGVGGLVLEKMHFKLPETTLPIAIALIVGGVLFLVIERQMKGKTGDSSITWTIAIAAGIGQLVAAVFPGASRSGTTIIAMMALGLNRPLATEFSFLIGIPTMLAAGGLKIFKALRHTTPGTVPENWTLVIIGFLVAAVVSFVVVRWLLRYVQTHTFTAFGWYRIILGILLLLLVK